GNRKGRVERGKFPAAPHSQESRGTNPDPYSGQPSLCRGFLFQCSSMFQQRTACFTPDAAKIRYMCAVLRGRALQWAEPWTSIVLPLLNTSQVSQFGSRQKIFP
uniref:DUF4939 domain-containing protein n=1 Tax=Periophthalmus magnuspinnatus TaxID=409849 RepID=A0A3B4BF43_9GOBI